MIKVFFIGILPILVFQIINFISVIRHGSPVPLLGCFIGIAILINAYFIGNPKPDYISQVSFFELVVICALLVPTDLIVTFTPSIIYNRLRKWGENRNRK